MDTRGRACHVEGTAGAKGLKQEYTAGVQKRSKATACPSRVSKWGSQTGD